MEGSHRRCATCLVVAYLVGAFLVEAYLEAYLEACPEAYPEASDRTEAALIGRESRHAVAD